MVCGVSVAYLRGLVDYKLGLVPAVLIISFFFFFQAEDGIRDLTVTGVQTCALPISTTEVESALVSHPKVAESAVVGATDPTTGQAIVAFVILRGGAEPGEVLVKELRDHVAKTLGPIAKPRQIMLVAELPKTRSGKIMRRLLRDVAENRSLGDVTTLQDSAVMDLIQSGMQSGKSED